jgi:hypothetical protein
MYYTRVRGPRPLMAGVRRQQRKTMMRLLWCKFLVSMALAGGCGPTKYLVQTECHWWQQFHHDAKDYQALNVVPVESLERDVHLYSDRALVENLITFLNLYKPGDVILRYEQDKDEECFYGYLLLRDCKLLSKVQIGSIG